MMNRLVIDTERRLLSDVFAVEKKFGGIEI